MLEPPFLWRPVGGKLGIELLQDRVLNWKNGTGFLTGIAGSNVFIPSVPIDRKKIMSLDSNLSSWVTFLVPSSCLRISWLKRPRNPVASQCNWLGVVLICKVLRNFRTCRGKGIPLMPDKLLSKGTGIMKKRKPFQCKLN